METKKIRFKSIKSYDFKPFLASGVHGGLSTNGLINANFFIDRSAIPVDETVTVSSDNKIIGKPIENKDADVEREFLCSVLMDISTAKLIADWLTQKVKEFESLKK